MRPKAVGLTSAAGASPEQRARRAVGPFSPDPTAPDFGAEAYDAAVAEAEFAAVQGARCEALQRLHPQPGQWGRDTPSSPERCR